MHLNAKVDFDYDRAFCRSIGVVSSVDLNLLRSKRLAIAGCGGVGGAYAHVLARLGVGGFHLADLDFFELENMNRQFGARMATLGLSKVDVIANDIHQINPTAFIKTFSSGIDSGNVRQFISGVDLVIDGLDFFAFEARRTLFEAAESLRLPVLTAAPIGCGATLLAFAPGGMSFARYFDWRTEDDELTLALKFVVGLTPNGWFRSYVDPRSIDLKAKTGPSSAVGVTLCASFVGAAALKWLLDRSKSPVAPYYLQCDAYSQRFKRGHLFLGNRHPWRKLKIYLARRYWQSRR